MDNLDKRMMQTPDLNRERLEKLKSLFPDLFTIEGKLNPDELEKIIDPDLAKETERFEFKWFGKSEAKRTAFTHSKATLIYDDTRSINPDIADGNMIIEGENLETMKCLLSAYREKIKFIYIDPPYNKDRDYIYTDRWNENIEDYWERSGITENGIMLDTNNESSGRFHSNWLNMIYARLLIARQLLSDDGIIFISIDDNEYSNLKKLCDEVFGAENCITSITREVIKGGSRSKDIRRVHDYVLCYSKYKDQATFSGYEKEGIELNLKDHKGNYAKGRELNKWGAGSRREDTPGMYFPIEGPNGEEVYPIRNDGTEGRWRWGKKKMHTAVKNKDVIYEKRNDGTYIVYEKIRESKAGFKQFTSIFKENYLNSKGTEELKKLFKVQKSHFDYAKPKELIYDLMLLSDCDNSDICLDFFAGSGTTGQAVIEYNKDFESDCKFILIQIPELTDESSEAYKAGYKTISQFTIDRNKIVIDKIEKGEKAEKTKLFTQGLQPFKAGFKVYKLAKSNFPRVDFAPEPAKSEEENLALLNKYIEEKESMFLAMIDEKNIFDEVLLKNGFMLNYKLEQVDGFSKNKVFYAKDDFKECLICMETSIKKETLKELEKYKDKIFVCLERSLDTTMKWNLKHLLGDKLIAF